MALSKLIEDMNAGAVAGTEATSKEKMEIIQACDALLRAYEDPMATLSRLIFAPAQLAALRIAIGMKIFDGAATFKGEEFDIQQLTAQTGGDALLTRRILRMLVGMRAFIETERGFTVTPLGAAFVTVSPFSDAVIHFSHNARSVTELPKYLEKTGYQNPGDAYDGPFQFAFNTNLHQFEHLATLPREQEAFNSVMAFSRHMKGLDWFEYYPVATNLTISSPSQPLIVDVGGGTGHDLIAFKTRFPSFPGKLITQDIPAALSDIKDGSLPEGIEAMPHDFFNAQPVKGAKAYFLRHILHDWPDKQALQIVKHIRHAMTEESILFIEETEIPERGASLRAACMDLTMMAAFSAQERTREQFKELLEEAGLVLVKVWFPEAARAGQDTLFEARLKA